MPPAPDPTLLTRSLDAASWLRGRVRLTGAGYLARRAVEAVAGGGLPRLQAHLAHAAASAARERRYQLWLRETEPRLVRDELERFAFNPAAGPRLAILVPLYETPEWMLRRCVESVLHQTYDRWRLCLVDDASPSPHVARLAAEFAAADPRIHFHRRPHNAGIAAATSDALALADADYLLTLDHDDELHPEALRILAGRVVADPSIELLYTDEDKIDENGRRHNPAFKTAFNPAWLLTSNYICHLTLYRTSLVRDVGGWRTECNGAQDYDLTLRAVERARRIDYVPLVLYHWRTHAQSTAGHGDAKPYAVEAGRRALRDHVARLNLDADVVDGPFKLTYRVLPRLTDADRVAAYVRSRPGSTNAQRTARLLRDTGRVITIHWLDNDAPCPCDAACRAPWRLVVDDDLLPDDPRWLDRLIQAAKLPWTAAVGPKIVDAAGRVESAGFVREAQGLLRPVHRGCRAHDPGYLWSLMGPRHVDALSASCILTPNRPADPSAPPGFAQVVADITLRRDAPAPRTTPPIQFTTPTHHSLASPNLPAIEPTYLGA